MGLPGGRLSAALGALTANALASVEELYIPVEAHVMAMAGLVQLLRG